jgi:hypothetical protein
MPTSGRPLEGTLVDATAIKTNFSTTTVVQLFKAGWTPTSTSVGADFDAHEATYQGYAPVTIAAWVGPYVYGGGAGYFIAAADQYFAWAAGSGDASNSIGGYWIEDAAGKVREYVIFDSEVLINGAGQVIPVTPTILFPAS